MSEGFPADFRRSRNGKGFYGVSLEQPQNRQSRGPEVTCPLQICQSPAEVRWSSSLETY